MFLFENFPDLFFCLKSLTFNSLIRPLIISIFFRLEKKFLIESICVPPIPSKFTKYSKSFALSLSLKKVKNFFTDLKYPAKIFAFS